MLIYTVGHSTRTQEALMELLKQYGVRAVIDIRAIPYSRHNPQFNREEMQRAYATSGIRYQHVESLGGKRPPKEVMERARSCSERSRGFAEYMRTATFQEGIQQVMGMANTEQIALMCAEADPTHCHRFWVADALVERGVQVRHIINENESRIHPANLFTAWE
ncbi:MAG: DUF488 domain-containing protein [Chlorobi bacterium]|nr:MAG: hypothetical protein UZ07_CHB004000010 [Chlorobi bacterium OLB7]MBK8910988.1 DUF488 domain-containing protein [Chlorobiota bacterium]MBX7216730.1 DUF488 domain-containing protein [Candidatus Kapabacteria bacterium]